MTIPVVPFGSPFSFLYGVCSRTWQFPRSANLNPGPATYLILSRGCDGYQIILFQQYPSPVHSSERGDRLRTTSWGFSTRNQ